MKAILALFTSSSIALCGCSLATEEVDPAEITEKIEGIEEIPIFANLSDDVPTLCEHGGITTMDAVSIVDDADILDGPKGNRIINEKATAALGRTFYQSVDHTEVLKEICRTEGWSKVQVTEPSSLSFIQGWVKSASLRRIESDKNGLRIYTKDDFTWNSTAPQHKDNLTAGVNRILRENANCARVDPRTLSESGDRSTASKPVFFITCYSPSGQPFNVWFEPEDALSDQRFSAIGNIDRASAVQACQQAAKDAAQNPRTVNFSTFMDVAFLPYPNGRSRLLSSFSASNAFGVEGDFNIGCLFEGHQLIETSIGEKRG